MEPVDIFHTGFVGYVEYTEEDAGYLRYCRNYLKKEAGEYDDRNVVRIKRLIRNNSVISEVVIRIFVPKIKMKLMSLDVLILY